MATATAIPAPIEQQTSLPDVPQKKQPANGGLFTTSLCRSIALCTSAAFQPPQIQKILALRDRCVIDPIPKGGHKISGKEQGIDRSLLVTNQDCVLLMTRTKKGDKPLYKPDDRDAKPPSKVVKTGVDLLAPKKVAIAITKKALCDAEEIDDARHEVELLKKLQGKPGIVQLQCAVETQEKVYAVLEFCNRGEVFEALLKGELTFQQKANVAYQFLQALKVLHEENILHRDLKAENLLLREDVETGALILKIADFNLSCEVDDKQRKARACGSLHLLPPEKLKIFGYQGFTQAQKLAKWGQKTTKEADIFQAGSVLYILLAQMPGMFTWQFPLVKDYDAKGKPITRNETQVEFVDRIVGLLRKHQLQELIYTDIEVAMAYLPDGRLENLIKKMTMVDPTRRPSIQDICEEFGPIYQDLIAPPTLGISPSTDDGDLMFEFSDDYEKSCQGDRSSDSSPSSNFGVLNPVTPEMQKVREAEALEALKQTE